MTASALSPAATVEVAHATAEGVSPHVPPPPPRARLPGAALTREPLIAEATMTIASRGAVLVVAQSIVCLKRRTFTTGIVTSHS